MGTVAPLTSSNDGGRLFSPGSFSSLSVIDIPCVVGSSISQRHAGEGGALALSKGAAAGGRARAEEKQERAKHNAIYNVPGGKPCFFVAGLPRGCSIFSFRACQDRRV